MSKSQGTNFTFLICSRGRNHKLFMKMTDRKSFNLSALIDARSAHYAHQYKNSMNQ